MPFTRRDHQVDYLGAALIVGGVSLLLLLLSLGGKEFEWGSAEVMGMGIASAVLLGLAIVQERRASEPHIPPRLFPTPPFRIHSPAALHVGLPRFRATAYPPPHPPTPKRPPPTPPP